jgi:cytochrome c5
MEGKVTMKAKHWIPGLLLVAAMGAAALSTPASQKQAARGAEARVKAYQAPRSAQAEDEGQRVFEQNCSRCHATPEGFSPRISGTIVRHMRVRANLSQHDEQLLLKYFNQ